MPNYSEPSQAFVRANESRRLRNYWEECLRLKASSEEARNELVKRPARQSLLLQRVLQVASDDFLPAVLKGGEMSDLQFVYFLFISIGAAYFGLRITAALEEIADNLSRIRIEWDNDDILDGDEWKEGRNGMED